MRHRLFTAEGGDAEPVFRIGLSPIAPADWFEPAEGDPGPRKDALLRLHPHEVWGEVEGSRAAQAEAAAMVAAAVGAAPVGEPPLWAAARRVEDDLCLMERREGGWTLTAASLCAPSFFTVAEALGRPLSALHAPVTGFNDAMLPRVSRIFDHLAVDTVLERRNWSVVGSGELFLPSSAPLRAALATMTVEEVAAALVVRRERQTIRRLPQTDAIVFTIRIWRERLRDLARDPERREAFAGAWARVMADEGEAFRVYKRLGLLNAAVGHLLAAPH